MADDKERGLYMKYNVTRTDGKPMGEAIILEFKDELSRMAIQAWACKMFDAGYKTLYYDVQDKICHYDDLARKGLL
jgi:hypothetical protein